MNTTLASITALTAAFEDSVDTMVVGVVAIAVAAVGVIAIRVGFSALKSMFTRGH